MKICSKPACTKASDARGLCKTHYNHHWRNGDFHPRPKIKLSPAKFEQLRALKGQLKRAQDLYDVCVGLKSRMVWAEEINDVKRFIKEIEDAESVR